MLPLGTKQAEHVDFGRLLAEFDEPEMKNLLVQLDESCCDQSARPTANAGLPTCWKRTAAAAKKQSAAPTLAAARQSDDNAEQLLAQFCEQANHKHLSDYERRKK